MDPKGTNAYQATATAAGGGGAVVLFVAVGVAGTVFHLVYLRTRHAVHTPMEEGLGWNLRVPTATESATSACVVAKMN